MEYLLSSKSGIYIWNGLYNNPIPEKNTADKQRNFLNAIALLLENRSVGWEDHSVMVYVFVIHKRFLN